MLIQIDFFFFHMPLIAANNGGYFKNEIAALKLKTRKGEVDFEVDEHPRETTIDSLKKLPPVFKKNGLVTAGTASVRFFPKFP